MPTPPPTVAAPPRRVAPAAVPASNAGPAADHAPADPDPRRADRAVATGLLRELLGLRAELVADAWGSDALGAVHPAFRASARNLLHYLALRRRDLRPLQRRLAECGLSSLGRAESRVLATVDAVIHVLHRLAGPAGATPGTADVDFGGGQQRLAANAEALLGPPPEGRPVRIMVTLPSEAAGDYTLVHDLLRQGMDIVRINGAHDDPETWARMIAHVRQATEALGRPCRIVMDLAGPKLRTGPLAPGPAVVKVRPVRDVFGRVTAPARVWLTADPGASPPPDRAAAALPVPAPWLRDLREGERLRFTDTRGSKRAFTVSAVAAGGCWAETTKTAYLVPGTELRRRRRAAEGGPRTATVGPLPPREAAIRLYRGDPLVLTRDAVPGCPEQRDAAGTITQPAQIGCTLPHALDHVQVGEPIWFDDGTIGGVIERVEAGHLLVRVRHVRLGGRKLRAGKGINLPESDLRLSALTPDDEAALPFVASHADAVALSFASTAADVEALQARLAALGRRPPAIILKVETRRGFENLPAMLLAAMRMPCCGVMIARGDLAVECGFERLAEVQEEILWICEAAHVPVIWATQVLEGLAKQGLPSRAEISDAAMGHRAEAVMLNKGPHVLDAVRTLDDILRRMQAHQQKKQFMLRELHLAHAALDSSHEADTPT